MSRLSILICLGFLVLLSPFAGLPYSWLSVLLPLFGLSIIAIGFSIRSEQVRKAQERTPVPPSDEISPVA